VKGARRTDASSPRRKKQISRGSAPDGSCCRIGRVGEGEDLKTGWCRGARGAFLKTLLYRVPLGIEGRLPSRTKGGGGEGTEYPIVTACGRDVQGVTY